MPGLLSGRWLTLGSPWSKTLYLITLYTTTFECSNNTAVDKVQKIIVRYLWDMLAAKHHLDDVSAEACHSDQIIIFPIAFSELLFLSNLFGSEPSPLFLISTAAFLEEQNAHPKQMLQRLLDSNSQASRTHVWKVWDYCTSQIFHIAWTFFRWSLSRISVSQPSPSAHICVVHSTLAKILPEIQKVSTKKLAFRSLSDLKTFYQFFPHKQSRLETMCHNWLRDIFFPSLLF